ncbi:hypothetical protein [Streptomyces sp. RTd22]|uniref:hypothetical protein n=1 Tax=Streptomyces sp. RTd22 TaxID=1841249 RepID=UPI000ADB6C06
MRCTGSPDTRAHRCLVAYELRRDEPLVELRFFRSVSFTGAAVNALASFSTLGGFLFLTTLYLKTPATSARCTPDSGCCPWPS